MVKRKDAVLLKQDELNSELKGSMETVTAIITKSYLDHLEDYTIVTPGENEKQFDLAKYGNFYKLKKLVFSKEENFLNKLTTIVNVASVINCSIATVIRSDGSIIDYYFVLVSKNATRDTEKESKRRLSNAASFRGALAGNLTGSDFDEITSLEEIKKLKTALKNGQCYSSVSGIVALRDEDDKSVEGYVQGIENLVDSLKGQKYTLVMLADPISTSKLHVIKQGYELLHTQLSSFARSSVTINESDTLSISKARTEGISKGISQGISMTQSTTKSEGKYLGGSVSAGINFIVSANVGINGGYNWNTAKGVSQQQSTIESQQTSKQQTEQHGTAKASGKSLQLNYENRAVKALLDKIDKHLERLDECESFGAFDCAAYVIAETREIALTVASNYNALMRGKESCVQSSHVNLWYKKEDVEKLGLYLGALEHPRFYQAQNSKEVIVTPASIISGNELAIQIGLPKKSVAGVTVIPMAAYGRNIVASKTSSLELGYLYHMGHNEGEKGKEQKVNLDIESLSMHTFITGSTGSGKSSTIYSILDKLKQQKVKDSNNTIKFLVIEPAKGEYKDRFGEYPDVKVYGTNYKKTPLLKINPFSFPNDIHVLEHIDRLIEIFNVCWPMYAAMPAILKDSLERAYVVAGWNLETSEYRYSDSKGNPLFPSFIDVLEQVNTTMNESAYSADSKGDYKGALCTRLKSLTNGLYGQILANNELTGRDLFDSNVIIDLSRIGSSETKSLIMGLLVLKLQEYRMANSKGGNEELKHITVLEEAHNILKRTSTEQTSEGANVLGKSVEMLANSIAEMRTYGEGFIIADQAPGLMDLSVIRNTNTKIILRLPDIADRELVGRAAGLNDEQIVELSRLETFVAAVYQNNWLEPVLCNIAPKFKKPKPIYKYSNDNSPEIDKKELIRFLFLPTEKRKELDSKYVDSLIDNVCKLSVPFQTKVSFMNFTNTCDEKQEKVLLEKIIYHLFNSEDAFSLAKGKQDNIEEWYNFIKEVLDPKITEMTEVRQQTIVAILTKVKSEMDNKFEFFNDFMNSPLILIERNGF